MNAANALDVRAHDRLTICNNGERFPERGAEMDFMAGSLEPYQPGMKLRTRQQLKPAGNLLDLKCASVLFVKRLESASLPARLGRLRKASRRRETARGQRLIGREQRRLHRRENLIAGQFSQRPGFASVAL